MPATYVLSPLPPLTSSSKSRAVFSFRGMLAIGTREKSRLIKNKNRAEIVVQALGNYTDLRHLHLFPLRIYFPFNSPSAGYNDLKRIYTWHSRYAESLRRDRRWRSVCCATQLSSIDWKKKKLLSEEKGSSRRGPGSRVNLVLLQSKFPPSQRGRLINANSLTARTKYPRHNNCTRRLTLPRHAHPW